MVETLVGLLGDDKSDSGFVSGQTAKPQGFLSTI